jgi:hypothetical protein
MSAKVFRFPASHHDADLYDYARRLQSVQPGPRSRAPKGGEPPWTSIVPRTGRIACQSSRPSWTCSLLDELLGSKIQSCERRSRMNAKGNPPWRRPGVPRSVFGGVDRSAGRTPLIPEQRRRGQGSSAAFAVSFRNGSPGRTRTSDPAVNSRLLYQLSYRGSLHRGPWTSVTSRLKTPMPLYSRPRAPQTRLGRGPPDRKGLGGRGRNRTADGGFAVPCITILLPGPPNHPYHWQLRYRAFGPQARPRASSIVAVAHGQRRGLCGRMAIVAWHPRRYSPVNCE